MITDNLLAFRILYLLVQPFKDTKAFRLGVIDEKGNRLLDLNKMTPEQQDSYTMLHRLVFNLKRIMAKAGASGSIASYAAAYYLVKENLECEDVGEVVLEDRYLGILESGVTLVEEYGAVLEFISLFEDAPVNATGPAVSTDEPVIKPVFKSRKGRRFKGTKPERHVSDFL